MRTIAYCAREFEEVTRRAAGRTVFTCPPYSAADLPGLSGADLLYLDLHGRPGEAALYGDGYAPALTARQARWMRLKGCVVFAATCYLLETPFLEAFLEAGAEAVVAGPGENYAGRRGVFGAALLGLWIRRGLFLGMSIEGALSLARGRVALDLALSRGDRRQADLDALAFNVYDGGF